MHQILMKFYFFFRFSTDNDFITASSTSSITYLTTPIPPPTTTTTVRPPKLSLCGSQTQYYISDHGKESSIALDLEPTTSDTGDYGICKMTLNAQEPYGFVVKLYRPKTKSRRNQSSSSTARALGGVSNYTMTSENRTLTCPLKIVSII